VKKFILILVGSFLTLSASELTLRNVKQPLYLHGSDESPEIQITDVPIVSVYADPEWRFSAICKPFVPPSDGSWKNPADVNMASICGVKIGGTYKKNSPDLEVVIDATDAKVPEGYHFTIDQVVEACETCVRLMYPARPIGEGRMELKILAPTALSSSSEE